MTTRGPNWRWETFYRCWASGDGGFGWRLTIKLMPMWIGRPAQQVWKNGGEP